MLWSFSIAIANVVAAASAFASSLPTKPQRVQVEKQRNNNKHYDDDDDEEAATTKTLDSRLLQQRALGDSYS